MATTNTTDPKPGYVYNSDDDTWYPLLGIAPGSQVKQWVKTASGGETSVSGTGDDLTTLEYTAGTEQVYLNGVLLVRGSDYTATNGTTITGFSPTLSASDVVEVITYMPSNIQITNAVLKTDFTAKGDIVAASASGTTTIVPVGTNGYILAANSATTSGLEWIANDQGDLTAVTSGTGITVTNSTGPIPTVAVDTTVVATTSNTITMSGKTLTSPTINSATENNPILVGPAETMNISGSAPTATQNFDAITSGVHYFTASSTSNMTLNFRGSSTTSMNTLLATGGSATVNVLFTNGGTAYIPNTFQVDGSAVTVKWSGGTAPASGNASAIDAYSFTIIKTASATFTVLGAGPVKYA